MSFTLWVLSVFTKDNKHTEKKQVKNSLIQNDVYLIHSVDANIFSFID